MFGVSPRRAPLTPTSPLVVRSGRGYKRVVREADVHHQELEIGPRPQRVQVGIELQELDEGRVVEQAGAVGSLQARDGMCGQPLGAPVTLVSTQPAVVVRGRR